MLNLTTAKAYVSAIATGLGAVAAALLQAGVGGGLAVACLVVVAMLTAYGVTWLTPNAPADVDRDEIPA